MTDWTAILDGRIDGLGMDAHTAASTRLQGPVSHDRNTGRLEVTIGVVAEDVLAAAHAAAAALTSALPGATVHGVRVLPTEEFIAEVERPPGADLLGMSEVGELLGVSRQRAAELASRRHDFPPPIARLSATPVYTRASIEAFDQRWPRKRTGRPSAVKAS